MGCGVTKSDHFHKHSGKGNNDHPETNCLFLLTLSPYDLPNMFVSVFLFCYAAVTSKPHLSCLVCCVVGLLDVACKLK